MSGYTKLFNSIVTSTIWCGPNTTRIMWITMLALADRNGVVEGSIPGLAALARLTVDETRVAIDSLLAPDPDSRSRIEEGRRIREIPGGWELINHAMYREIVNAEDRREYLKIKQREHRAKKRQQMSNSVNNVSDKSTESTHASAEASAEAKTTPKTKSTDSPLPFDTDAFACTWAMYVKHRREIKKPLTPTATELSLRKLAAMGEGRAIATINNSIANGWQGLFEPKDAPGLVPDDPLNPSYEERMRRGLRI